MTFARRWTKLRSLDASQWRIVVVSVVLLPLVQVGLRLRGFGWTSSWLARGSDRTAVPASASAARRTADAVAIVAGRPVVGARCLGRSLLLWFLLRRQGVDAELVIGTAAPQGGRLPAHAWVEVAGEPVNDDLDIRGRFGSFELQLPRLRAPDSA